MTEGALLYGDTVLTRLKNFYSLLDTIRSASASSAGGRLYGCIERYGESPYGTVIESWYPIGHGDPGLINQPIFTELAKKYGKTNVQIILRWHIQEGNVIFPKSTNPQHIKDNFDIFDFTLNDTEMQQIKEMDNGKRFYTSTLEEQERNFSAWAPKD